jgi:hypothetical protein
MHRVNLPRAVNDGLQARIFGGRITQSGDQRRTMMPRAGRTSIDPFLSVMNVGHREARATLFRKSLREFGCFELPNRGAALATQREVFAITRDRNAGDVSTNRLKEF